MKTIDNVKTLYKSMLITGALMLFIGISCKRNDHFGPANPQDLLSGANPFIFTPTVTNTPTVTLTVTNTPIPKRVFISTGIVMGNFGGISVADSLCQSSADSQALGGTWIAWLSDVSTNVIDKLPPGTSWSRLDGAIVISDKSQITNNLGNPINIDETGATVPGTNYVWTGTDVAGNAEVDNCSNWGSTGLRGEVGRSDSTWFSWTASGDSSCTNNYRLYCFEL